MENLKFPGNSRKMAESSKLGELCITIENFKTKRNRDPSKTIGKDNENEGLGPREAHNCKKT